LPWLAAIKHFNGDGEVFPAASLVGITKFYGKMTSAGGSARAAGRFLVKCCAKLWKVVERAARFGHGVQVLRAILSRDVPKNFCQFERILQFELETGALPNLI